MFYMKKKREEAFRIRSIFEVARLPMVVFQSAHAGFAVLPGALDGLLKNWHDKGVVQPVDLADTDEMF